MYDTGFLVVGNKECENISERLAVISFFCNEIRVLRSSSNLMEKCGEVGNQAVLSSNLSLEINCHN